MFEVFKTNITSNREAEKIIGLLKKYYPGGKVNIDLADCDCVLRISHASVSVQDIKTMVQNQGFVCEELPD